jgi:hypothetical protein
MLYVQWKYKNLYLVCSWPVFRQDIGLFKYEGYSESNLWWAVKKQAMRKKILLYTKNKYISYFST